MSMNRQRNIDKMKCKIQNMKQYTEPTIILCSGLICEDKVYMIELFDFNILSNIS